MTLPPEDRHPDSPPSGTILNRQGWKPLATYTLMGITIAVYLLQMITQYALGGDYPSAIGMKVNNLIVHGQLWRLITPVFLHASLLHIGFNMYALYVLGIGMERFYGRGRYLALYFLSGFAGNVASFIFSDSPSLGASTAIFGLLGAEGVFFYQNREIFGSMARRSLSNVVMIAIVNLVIGLSPGIDNWGHLGGLVGGSIFAWIAGPHYQRQAAYMMTGLVDTRDSGDSIRASLAVGALFAIIAGIKIYFSA